GIGGFFIAGEIVGIALPPPRVGPPQSWQAARRQRPLYGDRAHLFLRRVGGGFFGHRGVRAPPPPPPAARACWETCQGRRECARGTSRSRSATSDRPPAL